MKTISINPMLQIHCISCTTHQKLINFHLPKTFLSVSYPNTHFLLDSKALSLSKTDRKTSSFLVPLSTSSNLFSWQPRFSKIRAENPQRSKLSGLKRLGGALVLVFVGGILFMRRFRSPSMVEPIKTNAQAPLEETIDFEKGNFDDELYVDILRRNPQDVEALKVLLYGKMREGKTKEAIKYVERLIEVEPGEVEWRLIQALSYELMGQLSKAKRLFKEILEENPLLLRALHGLALVLHRKGEGPAASEMLDKALVQARRENRVTEERNIKILIAQMHVVKGELEEGLKKFQDLVNEDPRDFRPYLCQGIIYSLLDKKKEAEEQFENYQSLVPQEFPQRSFLDDVMVAAKTESREQLNKEFANEYSPKE
ncbi:hypothetical protein AMTRI_Chr05g73670 [Amborella trichopoda]